MMSESPGGPGWGIVLDAVGTLIEPDPAVADVYAKAAARQGVALDREAVRARFVRAFRADLAGGLATDEPNESRRWRRIVSEVLAEVPDRDRAFEELWAHFARPDAWRCFPDVGPSIARWRAAGRRLRIASNFDGRLRAVVRGLPALAGLDEGIVISSEVGHRKPDPAFYRAVIASVGLPTGRIVCVGDDEESDVLGARRAGLHALLIDRRGRADGALAGLDELDGWIARRLD